ncbi:MAG TPA: hypothetical protein ENH29_04370 [Bacteroidetes bacterium]|nr:hypothetical protein [Bacteroidota bacterium]
MSQPARHFFFSLSDKLEIVVRKLRGAANRAAPQQALTMIDCEKQNWQNVRPAFVLSTGRAGTLLLNRLLLPAPNAHAVHAPRPELIRASKRAYEEIDRQPEIFAETFKSAREELIFEAALHNQIFIETNNRITFFAPVIRRVFPNAVFIHLTRRPADFVRSGLRRKWYSGTEDHDLGRIVPIQGEAAEKWDRFSLIEKIGWLWNETNRFIADFTATLKPEDFLFIRAEDLFTHIEITKKIYEFLHLNDFNPKRVAKMIQHPVNVQKKRKYPKYENWPESDKTALKNLTPLAGKYGYKL